MDYLKQVLDKEGIPYQVFAKDPQRPNLVARLKGNGKKRPILVMGHTDVVTVDPAKWTFPPFGATRDGGYVYGRGTIDDKDNLVASLMLVLKLKRENTALDRDVIFLAESGEEGAPEVGAQFMIDNHLDAINAEFCSPRAAASSMLVAGGASERSAPRRRSRGPSRSSPAARPGTARSRRARTPSTGCRRPSASSPRGRRRCASTRPPAPTSASWRRWSRPTWRRSTATS